MDTPQRELYASKIVVTVLKHEEVKTQIGLSTETFVRVRGEVKNAGDRTLEELHILAYFIDGKGQPHMMDQSTRQQNPTFTYCFPVLAHSTHPGGHREPLKPGQSRDFVAGVPMTYDGADTPGARVAGLVFARE